MGRSLYGQLFKLGLFIYVSFLATIAHGQTTPCTAAQKAEVLEAASSAEPYVYLNCSLTLGSSNKITKQIIIQGSTSSNLTLDCGGGSIGVPNLTLDAIYIRSKKNATIPATWSRPENVTIRNCTVYGGVRLSGMGKNGEAEDVRLSSATEGHTARAQAAAPKNIKLQNLNIVAYERTPVYFSPGVTYSSLTNSTLAGSTVSAAIYLDAESAYNTIAGNTISAVTGSREKIAIDGSAHNLIMKNRFLDLSTGGIFLYRNCGEGGTVRHQTPSYNQILNNTFFYEPIVSVFFVPAAKPSIVVSSRNGNRNYCGDDAGYSFGSSIDNRDLGRYNVIAQNIFYNASLVTPVQINESPNYQYLNENKTASTLPSSITRATGCYMAKGAPSPFILSGSSWTQVYVNGVATSDNYTYSCLDSVVTAEVSGTCVTQDTYRGGAAYEHVSRSWCKTTATNFLNTSLLRHHVWAGMFYVGDRGEEMTPERPAYGDCITQDTVRGGGVYGPVSRASCQSTCNNFLATAASQAYVYECRFSYLDNSRLQIVEDVLAPAKEPMQ